MTWWKVLGALIVLWILMGVIGFIFKGLFILFVIACVLFGFTLASSESRRRGLFGRGQYNRLPGRSFLRRR